MKGGDDSATIVPEPENGESIPESLAETLPRECPIQCSLHNLSPPGLMVYAEYPSNPLGHELV